MLGAGLVLFCVQTLFEGYTLCLVLIFNGDILVELDLGIIHMSRRGAG